MPSPSVVGERQAIGIQAFDGSPSQFPVAKIYDINSTLVVSLNLLHKVNGYYATSWIPTATGQYFVSIIFYSDGLHTTENLNYQREGSILFITDFTFLLSQIAANVWDEAIQGFHDTPNSAGYLHQIINTSLNNITNELVSNPTHSLSQLEQKIINSRNAIQADVALNKTTIDSLALQEAGYQNDLLIEHSQTRQDIFNHNANLDTRASNIDVAIGVNGTKIDMLSNQVAALHQQTKFVILIPQKLVRPDTGSKTYQFFISNYDNNGLPNNTDVLPRVTLFRTNGNTFLTETTMYQLGSNVGQYGFDFTLNPGTDYPILRAEFKITDNAQVYLVQRVTEITAFDGDSLALQAQITTIDNTTANISSLLTGGSGLAQIQTDIVTNRGDIGTNGSTLNAIKVKTDTIINNPVSTLDLNAVDTKIDQLPSNANITSALLIQTDSIKGVDGLNLTDINNNQRGTDNAVLANDPRLAFLDIAISSRSGHTLSDVWNFANRTLTTSAPLSNTEVAKIWDYLVSNISNPNSVGQLIKDSLDEPISTRGLTLTQLASALGPLALEATVSNILGSVINENNQNEVKLNGISDILNLIKPQTDKIINGGSLETTVVSENNATQNLITGLTLLLNNIKSKTDALPVDPASEGTVSQIPTNPLETNDPRLTNLSNLGRLDVNVSSRATPGDIPLDYAKASTLDLLISDENTRFNTLQLSINTQPDETYFNTKFLAHDQILLKLDSLGGSGFDSALHSLVAIRESIPTTSLSISAADVWNYSGRSLTNFPDFATTTHVSNQAQSVVDNLNNFRCNMTTTLKSVEDIQEVFCWLDLNNQTLTTSINARIVVNNGISDIWSGNRATPDSRGVFKISKAGIAALISNADHNYIMSITIEYNGSDYHTVQPFYTV